MAPQIQEFTSCLCRTLAGSTRIIPASIFVRKLRVELPVRSGLVKTLRLQFKIGHSSFSREKNHFLALGPIYVTNPCAEHSAWLAAVWGKNLPETIIPSLARFCQNQCTHPKVRRAIIKMINAGVIIKH